MSARGARDENEHMNSHDVGGSMLIPWLKTV